MKKLYFCKILESFKTNCLLISSMKSTLADQSIQNSSKSAQYEWRLEWEVVYLSQIYY